MGTSEHRTRRAHLTHDACRHFDAQPVFRETRAAERAPEGARYETDSAAAEPTYAARSLKT